MVNGKKLINFLCILVGIIFYNCLSIAMEKPYHHLPDGTFRNPEGSPERNTNFKWSYKVFNKEKKKLDMTVPEEHIVKKEKVLSDLSNVKEDIIFQKKIGRLRDIQVHPENGKIYFLAGDSLWLMEKN